jgi:NAD(P)H-quinone oxidoreductase subunit 5
MPDAFTHWPTALATLLLAVPLAWAAAAVVATTGGQARWRTARHLSALALAVALLGSVGVALGGGGVRHVASLLPLGPLGELALSARLDALTAVVLVLVCFVGDAILRYSQAYLDGDAGQSRYLRWFGGTLSAVTLLVLSDNLLLLALAWIATSLSLHQLLTYYDDRAPALIAAHKKFIASRVADACLLTAVTLVGLEYGTLEISLVLARVEGGAALPGTLQAAAVLLAAAAALKCAQLPFHGWLIQVMEAPTPVSALLHAGVVNIGGFLMIRLAPLVAPAEAAQTLLVVVGTATAAVAALVMMTRISIKVTLAWSTCAQMGFMLLQCGLGAYSLALLHLVAHSLYKAHAFLSSGSAVEEWRAAALAPTPRPAGLGRWLAAAALSIAGVALVGAAFGASPQHEPALWVLAAVVALAATPMIVRGSTQGGRVLATTLGMAVGVATLYFAWHAVATRVLAVPVDAATSSPERLAIALAGFGLLFALQSVMSAFPHGRVARALYPRLFAGLHLDELFTRLTFRVWPARLPARDRPASHACTTGGPTHVDCAASTD